MRFTNSANAAELIGDRIEEYLAACEEEGVTGPDCRLLLSPDPSPAEPAERVLKARAALRYALLILLLDLGLERLRKDLPEAVSAFALRERRATPYREYLDAAFQYFDLVIPYELLRDPIGVFSHGSEHGLPFRGEMIQSRRGKHRSLAEAQIWTGLSWMIWFWRRAG